MHHLRSLSPIPSSQGWACRPSACTYLYMYLFFLDVIGVFGFHFLMNFINPRRTCTARVTVVVVCVCVCVCVCVSVCPQMIFWQYVHVRLKYNEIYHRIKHQICGNIKKAFFFKLSYSKVRAFLLTSAGAAIVDAYSAAMFRILSVTCLLMRKGLRLIIIPD